MTTYKAVMRLALEYASSAWSPLTSSTSINGSNDNSLQVVELSGRQTCKLLATHPFKPFAAAQLTHYASKPQRPSNSSRSWQHILLSGDVHPNPGPTTKYPCPVCARNVTSRGVSYLCNRCSGWVLILIQYSAGPF